MLSRRLLIWSLGNSSTQLNLQFSYSRARFFLSCLHAPLLKPAYVAQHWSKVASLEREAWVHFVGLFISSPQPRLSQVWGGQLSTRSGAKTTSISLEGSCHGCWGEAVRPVSPSGDLELSWGTCWAFTAFQKPWLLSAPCSCVSSPTEKCAFYLGFPYKKFSAMMCLCCSNSIGGCHIYRDSNWLLAGGSLILILHMCLSSQSLLKRTNPMVYFWTKIHRFVF